jgi:DNA (cytosine-5)-methyltransferase 1
MSGDIAESGEAREEVAAGVGDGADGTGLPIWDIGDRRRVLESVDVAPTLLSKMGTGGNNVLDTTGNNAVAHAVEPYPNPANSLLAKANMSFRSDTDNIVRVGYAVRRLTPLECERLMGFPDGWTDIEGGSDTARYKALGNSVAVPCVEFIMQRIKDVKK